MSTGFASIAAVEKHPVLVRLKCQKVTDISLVLPEGMSFDEWTDIASRLKQAEKSVRWWIGDFMAYGERHFDNAYAVASELLGFSNADLRSMASISAAIPPLQRCKGLSWSHHREVAPLDPAAQKMWLDKAKDEELSVRELRQRVQLIRAAAQPTATTGPTFSEQREEAKCQRCGHECPSCQAEIREMASESWRAHASGPRGLA